MNKIASNSRGLLSRGEETGLNTTGTKVDNYDSKSIVVRSQACLFESTSRRLKVVLYTLVKCQD